MELITRWVQGAWFYWLVKHGFLWYARLFHGLVITGRDKVPRTGPLVVVSNHITTLDPPIAGSAVPREVHYMAKKELFENRYLRALVLGLRSYPVDRQGNASSAIKESIRRLKTGVAIGIFIQGTRNKGDAQALDGAAFIAQRAGATLQPAALWRRGRRYFVSFGEPLEPQGKSREEAAALTRELVRRINALLPEDQPKVGDPITGDMAEGSLSGDALERSAERP